MTKSTFVKIQFWWIGPSFPNLAGPLLLLVLLVLLVLVLVVIQASSSSSSSSSSSFSSPSSSSSSSSSSRFLFLKCSRILRRIFARVIALSRPASLSALSLKNRSPFLAPLGQSWHERGYALIIIHHMSQPHRHLGALNGTMVAQDLATELALRSPELCRPQSAPGRTALHAAPSQDTQLHNMRRERGLFDE